MWAMVHTGFKLDPNPDPNPYPDPNRLCSCQ